MLSPYHIKLSEPADPAQISIPSTSTNNSKNLIASMAPSEPVLVATSQLCLTHTCLLLHGLLYYLGISRPVLAACLPLLTY